jgi:hypothetical protein
MPPYTAEEIGRLVKTAEDDFKESEWKAREHDRALEQIRLRASRNQALCGLVLVMVGSACQAVAAWLGRLV